MKTTATTGIPFTVLLFLTFLVLKLCSVIGWSWWWVTAPLWIPVAGVAALVLMVVTLGMICNKEQKDDDDDE